MLLVCSFFIYIKTSSYPSEIFSLYLQRNINKMIHSFFFFCNGQIVKPKYVSIKQQDKEKAKTNTLAPKVILTAC